MRLSNAFTVDVADGMKYVLGLGFKDVMDVIGRLREACARVKVQGCDGCDKPTA
jgi:hypothetical protein